MSDKYADTESTKASKKMFDAAGVKYREYPFSSKEIKINL